MTNHYQGILQGVSRLTPCAGRALAVTATARPRRVPALLDTRQMMLPHRTHQA